MRIDELDQFDDKMPFDVVDDVAIFMRNDPMFYRKSFFPAVLKMQDCNRRKKPYNAKTELGPVIEQAKKLYCSKFKIDKRPEELLDANEMESLINKIYSEEMTQIRNGAYK